MASQTELKGKFRNNIKGKQKARIPSGSGPC